MPRKSQLLCILGILSYLHLTFTIARADEVLVTYIPKSATKSQVVAIIKQSFINRQWTIEKSNENSVTAGLQHRFFDCHVTISLSDNVIIYGESCTQTVTSGGPNNTIPRKQPSSAPTTWISNLRADISQSLAAIPDIAPSQNFLDNPNDAEERLRVLVKLRESGLISEQEFEEKRREIIRNL